MVRFRAVAQYECLSYAHHHQLPQELQLDWARLPQWVPGPGPRGVAHAHGCCTCIGCSPPQRQEVGRLQGAPLRKGG